MSYRFLMVNRMPTHTIISILPTTTAPMRMELPVMIENEVSSEAPVGAGDTGVGLCVGEWVGWCVAEAKRGKEPSDHRREGGLARHVSTTSV
eukprot:CAMPEP_0118980728 /NCGR_PEP_ID=MMETSP1173-20130426/28995_1 /TAXON_ID=1034831 /ORGANISM="Rhizochromulina marina cf, Strain CCMP1243" /LENGTH=91 /DNA_ID=CAMNT_0006931093 /DNA_START=543 /DNA_END=818 /DNA_ORIENTATION=+